MSTGRQAIRIPDYIDLLKLLQQVGPLQTTSANAQRVKAVVDALKVMSLHLAVLIGLYRFADLDTGWLLLPIGFSIVAGVTFFGMILNDLLKGKRGVASSTTEANGTFVRSLILVPTDYGLLCLVFLLWGWPPVFLILYAALFVANAAFLVLAAIKWFRDMVKLDADAHP